MKASHRVNPGSDPSQHVRRFGRIDSLPHSTLERDSAQECEVRTPLLGCQGDEFRVAVFCRTLLIVCTMAWSSLKVHSEHPGDAGLRRLGDLLVIDRRRVG